VEVRARYGEFIGQQPLTKAEIDTFERWTEQEAPEGALQDLPPVPPLERFVAAGTPDLVLTSSQPYTLQADGTDVFRVFVTPFPSAPAVMSKAWNSDPTIRA